MNTLSTEHSLQSQMALQGLGQKADQLKEVCGQVEGLFASILLKEGLKPLLEETEEGESHMGGLMELTIEHVAQDIGKEGALGIADAFYGQLSENLPSALPVKIQKGNTHE